MPKHLERDLEHLKKEILKVGSLVEEAIGKAIKALMDRRPETAREVIDGDSVIDAREVEVEEQCLKILALHQPVAIDLRFIVAVMKVNNDLERMADLAANIAERAVYLATHDAIRLPAGFSRMAETVRTMVRQSLDALVNMDEMLARSVLRRDDEVDAANREMFDALQQLMHDDPLTIERAVHALSSSRNLERIADHATNIAEDVIFMIEGDVVRHVHGGQQSS
ncbi:MAG: phosphate signaling complex protein PhoU [Verrucomicrobia bacterium]|nr:phosphate signaling complex protein PhoU [Verrucomicrobiota bacterium]